MWHPSSLHKLFDTPPVVVSDSRRVMDVFDHLGFSTYSLADVCSASQRAPEAVVLITCRPENIPSRGILNNTFRDSAVLIVPMVSFSAQEDAIDYLGKTILKIDWQAACAANLKLVEKLERTREPIVVQSAGHSLLVELSLSLEIALPKLTPKILNGEWVSIGQFLEIGLVPNEGHTAFCVNGTLQCDGAAVAHHRHNLEVARPLAFKAWDELALVRSDNGFPLTLSIHNSKVTSIQTAKGQCILDRLLPLTDEVFRSYLIEVAFASLEAFSGVDWMINSQLNEGAGGCHVALGTGVYAAHIDFISSAATVLID